MITVEHLSKSFRRPMRKEGAFSGLRTLLHPTYTTKLAVDDISFTIAEGEMVGYIGPNGAGKSTSIKMLSGILVPSSGHVEVGGLIPHRERKEHARQIGVVFGQKTQLWWEVPVLDSLRLLRDIYRISEKDFQRNLEIFHDLLDLHEFQHVPVRQLSLGQRLRADLSAAFLHDPRVLFLDEPTIGVDVVAKERLRAFIRTINRERKVTVLLTTHDMGDIEKLCNRMLMIDHGRVVYDGSVEQIRHQYGRRRMVMVEFEQEVADFAPTGTVLERSEGRRKWFAFDREAMTPSKLIAQISAQHAITDLSVLEPEIEDMVRSMYEGVQGRSEVAAKERSL